MNPRGREEGGGNHLSAEMWPMCNLLLMTVTPEIIVQGDGGGVNKMRELKSVWAGVRDLLMLTKLTSVCRITATVLASGDPSM